jgi:hypothetical protein
MKASIQRPAVLLGTSEQDRRGWGRAAARIAFASSDIALWPVLLNSADQSQAPEGQASPYMYATNMPPHADSGGWG